MKRFALLGLAAALASSPLSAQTVLNDNFNGENGGNTFLNYSSFANWTVGGQVDLVRDTDFGIRCFGNTGSCVDLDGSSGPGALITQYFAFNAGERVRFSAQISGNQRVTSQLDDVTFDLAFAGPVTIGNYTGTGGWAYTGYFGASTASVNIAPLFSLAGNDPFSLWSFEFDALTAGSVMFTVGTDSGDNVGPIIDNVQIDRTTVTPEPSTWAMLAFGMGAVGFVSRRRARKA